MSRFAPFSGVLRSRAVAWGIVAFGAFEVGLTAIGVTAWVCPLRAATGVPCPGCGMTHAVAALARGEWAEALRIHPLAPVVAACGALVLLAAVLPERPRLRLLAFTGRFEGPGTWTVLLLAFFAVWVWRYTTGALAHL